MKIKIDYNFCIDDIIGVEGISYKDLNRLSNITKKIHLQIKDDIKSEYAGFYNLPFYDTKIIKETVLKYKENFNTCVVLGIGGSALGAIAIYNALKDNFKKEKLFIIDNIDPDIFYELLNKINLKETFFTVISKSGSTAETIAQFLIVRKILIEKFGKEVYKKHIFIITDPQKGELRKLVNEENYDSLAIPENVGGRFSVLSPVGLFPLAFAGIDINLLLEGAIYYHNIVNDNDNILENPSYILGAIHYLSFNKGKNINVLMPYSSKLISFADWFRQLWAESLGKNNLGQTPVKAVGATDQHSQLQLYIEGPKDKIIGFIKVERFQNDIIIPEQTCNDNYKYLMNHTLGEVLNNELDATRVSLAKNGVMNYIISINSINPFVLGQLIFLFQIMTHFTGYLFEINPFDQPGVEMGKKFTYAIMGRNGYHKKREEFELFINNCKKQYSV